MDIKRVEDSEYKLTVGHPLLLTPNKFARNSEFMSSNFFIVFGDTSIQTSEPERRLGRTEPHHNSSPSCTAPRESARLSSTIVLIS